MIYLSNDYSEGAHPNILKRLIDTNMEQLDGYGFDKYCEIAKEKIKKICNCDNAEVYFLEGGTQTNQIAIASILSHYEGILCAESGHINNYEAGAIESTGHKVLTIPHENGKITAEGIDEYITKFYQDSAYIHKVYPSMVFISQPTEYGTIYSKKELEKISNICKKWEIPLYIDGARIIYALASSKNDTTFGDIANYADAFYIGGTKAGLLFGEALVFTKNNAPKNYTTIIKRQGALLAKGRLLGLQFDELFTDDLYKKLGENAINQAKKIEEILKSKGYELYMDVDSNQVFAILEKTKAEEIARYIKFLPYKQHDENHILARFVTSWATTDSQVKKLEEVL